MNKKWQVTNLKIVDWCKHVCTRVLLITFYLFQWRIQGGWQWWLVISLCHIVSYTKGCGPMKTNVSHSVWTKTKIRILLKRSVPAEDWVNEIKCLKCPIAWLLDFLKCLKYPSATYPHVFKCYSVLSFHVPEYLNCLSAFLVSSECQSAPV